MNCVRCFAEYTGHHGHFCSDTCRKAAYRERHRTKLNARRREARAARSAEAVQARYLAEIAYGLGWTVKEDDARTPAHARVDRADEGDEGREVGERPRAPGARPSSDGPEEPSPSRTAADRRAQGRDLGRTTPRPDRPSIDRDPAARRHPPAPAQPTDLEDSLKHRHSTPPPHPRASVQHADLAPGLNVVDGVPILRLGRAAFDALDGGRSLHVADLDGADDVLDIEAAS